MLNPILQGGQLSQQVRGVIAPTEGADSNASRSQTEQLYAQFSSILDKIALHLSDNSELPFDQVLQKVQEVKEPEPDLLREDRPELPPKCEAGPCHAEDSATHSEQQQTDEAGQSEGEEAQEAKSADDAVEVEESEESSEEVVASEEEAPEEVTEGDRETEDTEEAVENEEDLEEEGSQEELVAEEVEAAVEELILEELEGTTVEAAEEGAAQQQQVQLTPEQIAAQSAQQQEVAPEDVASQEVSPEAPELPKQAAQQAAQMVKPEVDSEGQQQELPQQAQAAQQRPLSAEERFLEDIQALNLKSAKPADSATTKKASNDILAKVVQMLLSEDGVSAAATDKQGPQRNITSDSMVASLMMRQALDNFTFGKGVDVGGESGQLQGIQGSRGHEQAGSKEQGSLSSDTKSAARTRHLTRGQTARTLDRVQSVLKEMARSRDGKSISLRLDPPSLGSVRVDVSYRDGALFARLAADNPAVNQLLRDKSHELQKVLRELGLNADQVNVSVSSDSEDRGYEEQKQGFSKKNEGSGESGSSVLGGAVQGLDQTGKATVDEDHWVA